MFNVSIGLPVPIELPLILLLLISDFYDIIDNNYHDRLTIVGITATVTMTFALPAMLRHFWKPEALLWPSTASGETSIT